MMRSFVLAAAILALATGFAQAQSTVETDPPSDTCADLVIKRDSDLSQLLAAQTSIPSSAEVLKLQQEVSDTVSALELAKRTMDNAVPNFAQEVADFDQMVLSFIDSDQAEAILKAQIDDSVERLRATAYQLIEIRRAEAAVRTMNDQLVDRVTAYNERVVAYNERAAAFQALQTRLQDVCGITPVVSFATETQGT